MDVVNEIFKSIHFDANIYLHSEFCSPWGVESNHPGLSSFHVIAYGNCQLIIKDQPVITLSAGDLIFFSRNTPHQLINDDENNEISTTLVCGHLTFSNKQNPVLMGLPQYLHIKANEMDRQHWFKSLFQQIVNEAESNNEGRQLVLDKLAEVLFIYVVRYYISSDQHLHSKTTGLLKGLSNPNIAKSLVAFHNQIGQAWNLNSLADKALISRSKFAALFNELLGVTPLKYMTYWRMQHAKRLLKNTTDSIFSIALDSGYQSEAAFIKVFKKHFNQTPGQARRTWRKA